jgi:hypothetical protein
VLTIAELEEEHTLHGNNETSSSYPKKFAGFCGRYQQCDVLFHHLTGGGWILVAIVLSQNGGSLQSWWTHLVGGTSHDKMVIGTALKQLLLNVIACDTTASDSHMDLSVQLIDAPIMHAKKAKIAHNKMAK